MSKQLRFILYKQGTHFLPVRAYFLLYAHNNKWGSNQIKCHKLLQKKWRADKQNVWQCHFHLFISKKRKLCSSHESVPFQNFTFSVRIKIAKQSNFVNHDEPFLLPFNLLPHYNLHLAVSCLLPSVMSPHQSRLSTTPVSLSAHINIFSS